MSNNPTLPTTALLHPDMPDVYNRNMIYDPRYANNADYNNYVGKRIVPQPGSLVRDSDNTPLWVVSVDPVTHLPEYTSVPLGAENDNVVSLLNYGNSVLRLYVDYRHAPYPVTPDAKCVFIGKSPRFYTLTRNPGTAQASVISSYYDAAGKLVGQMVPLKPLDATRTSWYLPQCNTSETLVHNEEIRVTIYNEDGLEIYSSIIFAKESAVINESVIYAPTIVGMTVEGNQRLANGSLFLYEKQDFASLGLKATLVYDDGTTQTIPIDGQKCILYGQSDFIASFSGLQQKLMVKYFRSESEAVSPGIADQTGSMISVEVPVMVIPNTLGSTVKIIPVPIYQANTARYVMRYYMYSADGNTSTDITAYTSIVEGTLVTDSSRFGVSQTYVVGVDMNRVAPLNYPVSTFYQQTIVIQFGPPTQLVKWTIRDSATSPNIYGIDNSGSRRPSIRYDRTLMRYFIPSSVFGNLEAMLKSFYYQSSPPYDPSVEQIPQRPTHFVVRDPVTGNMLVAAPIPVASFAQAFAILGDTTGLYLNSVVLVEFLNVINSTTRRSLFGGPVDVTVGSYVPT